MLFLRKKGIHEVKIDEDKLRNTGLERLKPEDIYERKGAIGFKSKNIHPKDDFVSEEEFEEVKKQLENEDISLRKNIAVVLLQCIMCICLVILLFPTVKRILTEMKKTLSESDTTYVNVADLSDEELKDLIGDIEIVSTGASGDIIYGDNVESANVNYAYNIWYMIPTQLREEFAEDEWKVSIIAGEMKTLFPEHAEAEALTVTQNKMIYVENRQKTFRRSLVHEFGHYYDTKNGRLSESQEFVWLYENESYNLYEVDSYNNNGKSNSSEYFAECFEQYIMYPRLLKSTCPKTYEFMEGLNGLGDGEIKTGIIIE